MYLLDKCVFNRLLFPTYNCGNNTLEYHRIPVQVSFTTSKAGFHIECNKLCIQMASRVAEQQNLSLKIGKTR